MYLKRRLPVWLHADMRTLQNKMFNYVFHGQVNHIDRSEIQAKWDKIKTEMDTALSYMDEAVTICSSKNLESRKTDDKLPVCTPKAH